MPAVTFFTQQDIDTAEIHGELNTAGPRPFGVLHLDRNNAAHIRTADDARRMIEALTEIAIGLDFHARAIDGRVPATAAPARIAPPPHSLPSIEVPAGAEASPGSEAAWLAGGDDWAEVRP